MCATRAKNSVLRTKLTTGCGAHAGGPNSSLIPLLLLLVVVAMLGVVLVVGCVSATSDVLGDFLLPMLPPLLAVALLDVAGVVVMLLFAGATLAGLLGVGECCC